ncbi:uncharacterized protein LOC125024896 [Penaeus chinensis]|uniref:uncharacterized protein LOC125024896 n=1 Tax=Penaeus chinensis TaxID=139456 RepID=UPI001FB638F9|nr:uncharacterized protein LOC125024896 [Penaeus chinensis]
MRRRRYVTAPQGQTEAVNGTSHEPSRLPVPGVLGAGTPPLKRVAGEWISFGRDKEGKLVLVFVKSNTERPSRQGSNSRVDFMDFCFSQSVGAAMTKGESLDPGKHNHGQNSSPTCFEFRLEHPNTATLFVHVRKVSKLHSRHDFRSVTAERTRENRGPRDAPSFSLVWRPLVSKFSRDPELVYWVPPLYLSGDTLRLKKNEATEIQSPTSLGRLRPKQLVSGRGSRNPTSSRANLLTASEETLYFGWTPKNPLNFEGSEHFYEKTPTIFQMHRNPMNFLGQDYFPKRNDSFSYERNHYKMGRGRSEGSSTPSQARGGPANAQGDSRGDEESLKDEVFGSDPEATQAALGKPAGYPAERKSPVRWPEDIQDVPVSPGSLEANIMGWTATHTYMNDSHLLHKMAARSLTPQTPSTMDRKEHSVWNLPVQKDPVLVLNIRLYVVSVVMLLFIGVVLTIIIVETARHRQG